VCFVRVFGIGATAADVVAVLRRGPSGWCHVGRWDIAARRHEPGSWLRGTLYPQRCDLSADGRYLCYFPLKGESTWELGATCIAISRLPWLTARAAWRTSGTWTRGAHFVADADRCDLGPPDAGDTSGLRDRRTTDRNHRRAAADPRPGHLAGGLGARPRTGGPGQR
jgi:hypothetical protein